MGEYKNHTKKLEKRIEEILVEEQDTCSFFREKEQDKRTDGQTCQDCHYGNFERDNKETTGYCSYGQGTILEQQALINTKQMLEALVSNIKGGVITCLFDLKTQSSKVVYINEGWTAITGYTKEELNQELNGNPQALVFSEDKKIADRDYAEQTQKGPEYELMYRVIRKDGSTIWVMDRGVISILEGGVVQNQSIISEITEIKEREERLRRLAQTDQLTDLNNKVTFTLLSQKILERQNKKKHAVMVIDIDCFKGINDTRGHAFGDIVLQSIATKLKTLVTKKDILGRTGGDEFMVFLTDIESKKAAKQKAEQVCEAIKNIRVKEDMECGFSVSVGVSVSEIGTDYLVLCEEADKAMYQAKNSGKGCSKLFEK